MGVIVKIMTLSEYNAIHPDFRGVWTTEREDWPDWPEVRHLYMGKRTLLEAGCRLAVEGLHFEISNDLNHKGARQ